MNKNFYAQALSYYRNFQLNLNEIRILKKFYKDWHNTRMLDIGIGCGRTSYTFSALCKNYVGIDYVPEMIEDCINKFEDDPDVNFIACDARELSKYKIGTFDFILFSMNGIDSVGYKDRIIILNEIFNVLNETGHLFFSFHSINSLPLKRPYPTFDTRNILKSIYNCLEHTIYLIKLKNVYKNTNIEVLKHGEYAELYDFVHNFKHKMKITYLNPMHQIKILHQIGYEVLEILDVNAKLIGLRQILREESEYIHLLCRKKMVA